MTTRNALVLSLATTSFSSGRKCRVQANTIARVDRASSRGVYRPLLSRWVGRRGRPNASCMLPDWTYAGSAPPAWAEDKAYLGRQFDISGLRTVPAAVLVLLLLKACSECGLPTSHRPACDASPHLALQQRQFEPPCRVKPSQGEIESGKGSVSKAWPAHAICCRRRSEPL